MGIVQDVLVEQDHTRTQSNPGTALSSVPLSASFSSLFSPPSWANSHHVEGRVQSSLGRLLLLHRRVDGGQGGLVAGHLRGGA